ncbi:MAG: hypothetical protein JJU02_14165 [Cryomorphaceae bacterium]|nr:hypothetical protein [Cryomorphaceae bacterium]
MHRLLILVVFLTMVRSGFGQFLPTNFEWGVSLGNMVYNGNFTPNPDFNSLVSEQGPRFGFFTRYNMHHRVNFGVEVNYGNFHLDDANHGRPERGVQVTTHVFNANAAFELHLLAYRPYKKLRKVYTFSPYFKFGGGINFFSPVMRDYGMIDLGNTALYPYSYASFNVFGGGGLKFRISKKNNLSLEMVIHHANARNMAGITPNPNPSQFSDFYGGAMIHYTWLIF